MPAETHTHQAPLDRAAVLAIFVDRLAEILQIEPTDIHETDSLAADLHADSLALFELIEALEDEFGERTLGPAVELDDLEDLDLVKDAVDYVVARLA